MCRLHNIKTATNIHPIFVIKLMHKHIHFHELNFCKGSRYIKIFSKLASPFPIKHITGLAVSCRINQNTSETSQLHCLGPVLKHSLSESDVHAIGRGSANLHRSFLQGKSCILIRSKGNEAWTMWLPANFTLRWRKAAVQILPYPDRASAFCTFALFTHVCQSCVFQPRLQILRRRLRRKINQSREGWKMTKRNFFFLSPYVQCKRSQRKDIKSQGWLAEKQPLNTSTTFRHLRHLNRKLFTAHFHK